MKIKKIALLSILLLLLIAIPVSFAVDNSTDNDTDVLTGEYYFDANFDKSTGNGTLYNPYKELTPSRIQDNSIIHLSSGEYDFESNSKTINNVTIIGENTQNTVIKNAKFTTNTVFNLYNVTLISSTIINNGNLKAVNTAFKESSSSNGGVINSLKNTNIINCSFIDNSAEFGGAIYIKDGVLSIRDSQFLNNQASMFGGAIISINSNINITNVSGKNNKANYDGGFIYSIYGTFIINNSTFEENTADNGAVAYVDQVTYDIIMNNKFINNSPNICGVIYSLYNFNSTIENNQITDEELYQSIKPNMFIGNGNYTLYHYNDVEITDIPSRYNLADYGYVTSVKNQGSDGNCWAFATIATLESCILKALGENYDLSESNVKNIFGNYGNYGWTYETNKGGIASMGYNYLISWLGPVLDIDDPYIVNSIFSRVMDSVMHVQNVLFIQRKSLDDLDEVKKIIMTYGAVYSQIYKMPGKTYQYYNNGINANHAITIVGWDDDLTFSGAPGKGGWIYKNSWGPTSGDHGYYYASYYDTSILPVGKIDGAFTFILNDTIKFDKNYQYDIQGKSDFFVNSSDTVWYKNKFISTDNEYLTAVSTIFEKETNYLFSIYVNGEYKLSQSGFSKPGYFTFNLNKFIPLNVGDEFEIVFKISVDNEAAFPISEKVSFMKCLYNVNTSFLSYDGENWVDLYNLTWAYSSHTYNSQVACIKAFTVLNPINTSIKLEIDNIDNDTCDIIATVYNEWGYIVDMGEVTFTIYSDNYTLKLTDGFAKLTNISLKNNLNKFSAQFNCLGYITSNNFVMVSVPKTNTTIALSIINDNNPIEIHATVNDNFNNPVESGQVIFNVEGENYTVEVVNGIATLVHMFKIIGFANISAFYSDNYAYNPSNCSISQYVPIVNTYLNLTILNDHNNVTISAQVKDSENNFIDKGNVTFIFDGKTKTLPVFNGIVSFNYIFENEGIYNISAQYNGIDNYNSSMNSSSVDISFISTRLVLEINPNNHNPVEIIAYVYDEENNLVNMGNVIFHIENENYNIAVVNGIAKITHVFKNMGINNISANYIKNHGFDSSKNYEIVNISKIKSELSLSILKNLNNVTIVLTSSVNMDGEYVSLSLNNNVYSTKIHNSKAIFKFNNLTKGFYSVCSSINSYIFDALNVSGDFTIYDYCTDLVVDNNEFYYGNNILKVFLKNSEGDLIKNKEIIVKIGEKTFKNNTDEYGTALFLINLSLNDNKFYIFYEGDEDYNKSNLNVDISVYSTVISQDTTKTYNSNYEFRLLDNYGNPLRNTEINIQYDSVIHHLKSDENGFVSFNILSNKGSHLINIVNPINNESKIQTINVIDRITENKGFSVYYGVGKYYTVKVLDDNGNIAKGVKVKITINGKTYTRTTDSKGYASLRISLTPGKYTIAAEYKGFKVSNKITIKSTLITKNINVKKGKVIKFTAKLVNKNGKILKNKKITFKFKGKTYKIKTNKKGKATLKITKKYKRGKYTITTSYGKLKIKNTIKIK